MNQMPLRVLSFTTPLAVLVDHVLLPSTLHLERRVFGCVAYVHLHKNQRIKLDLCAVRCVFLGSNPQQKGYRCYHPSTRHMYVTMDVTFSEDELFFPPSHTPHEETTSNEDYGWFDIMQTVYVNSPNRSLDQIGPDATHQTSPDEANRDCPDRCADHGRGNGPELCDACPSGPHVVPSDNNDGSHANAAFCSPNYDDAAAVCPSAVANPSGLSRNYGVGSSGPSRVITPLNPSNSSSKLEDSNKHPHTPTDIPKVCTHLEIIEPSYMLPSRQNRGKPPDMYSLEGKVRYSISNYVSTHRLSPKYYAFV